MSMIEVQVRSFQFYKAGELVGVSVRKAGEASDEHMNRALRAAARKGAAKMTLMNGNSPLWSVDV